MIQYVSSLEKLFLKRRYISRYKCHDMIHDAIHHYIQLTKKSCKEWMNHVFCLWMHKTVSADNVLELHMLLCRHLERCDCKHAKQYKATMELFPFYGSHCLINSSERACTWVRSHKSQLFLNVESFIQT